MQPGGAEVMPAIPKTELSSDSIPSDTYALSLNDRIRRVEALHGQFRRGTTDLMVLAHRLGIELEALRNETRHGEWEKLFESRLTFIGLRTAYKYIKLARAFKTEDQFAGLTLHEASQLAREILGGRGNRAMGKRRKKARRGFIETCESFLQYLGRTRLGENAAQASLDECNAAIQRLTAIQTAAEKGLGEYEDRRKRLHLRLVGFANSGGGKTAQTALAGHLGRLKNG